MALMVRERPPLRLSVDATTPSGRHARWGMDSATAENIPQDLSFSSTVPGGFEQMSCKLTRRTDREFADLERLSTLRVLDHGGSVSWEGRLERTPRESGQTLGISPQAVGWQANLEDRKDARAIYVDRDLGHWRPMGRDRRIGLIQGGFLTPYDGVAQPDTTTGIPALAMEVDGEWAAGGAPTVETFYDAGSGQKLSSVYYDWQRVGFTAPEWVWAVNACDGDDTASITAGEGTGDLQNESNSTGQGTFTPAAPRRYFGLQFFVGATTNAQPGIKFAVYWRRPAVYGNHGLTKRGTEPAAGFYASDIIGHAVGAFAPALNYTTGMDGTIQASSFIVPQAEFREPTTAAEIIKAANRFHLHDWAVWEDKTFHYYPRGSQGRAWRTRAGAAQLSETGPQVDRLYNSIVVQYADVDGTTKTVGPVGSGSDTESSTLTDSDTENPATKAGIVRRALLTMGTNTAAAATEVGVRFLGEQKLLDSSGSAQLVGYATDDRGVIHPAHRVRAGDTIAFVDASSTGSRRIVKAAYDHPTRTCSVDLDSPPDGMDALLQRLGVVLVDLGLS